MTDSASFDPSSRVGHPVLRTLGTLVWAWVACALAYLLGIVLAATVADSLPTTLASGVALVLVGLQVAATVVAIVWVHRRLMGMLLPFWRRIWVGLFALLQLGTCGIAGITALLALNR